MNLNHLFHTEQQKKKIAQNIWLRVISFCIYRKYIEQEEGSPVVRIQKYMIKPKITGSYANVHHNSEFRSM